MALLTLANAKLWLRVSGTSDDDTISDLVASIASHFAGAYGVIVDEVETVWTFDRFLNLMLLPVTPVSAEGLVVTYLDGAGDEQTLSGFRTALSGHHLRLMPAIGECWPATLCEPATVTVTGQAGWAEDAVPGDVVVAARLLLARWYDNRDAEQPKGVADLLDHYRLQRV